MNERPRRHERLLGRLPIRDSRQRRRLEQLRRRRPGVGVRHNGRTEHLVAACQTHARHGSVGVDEDLVDAAPRPHGAPRFITDVVREGLADGAGTSHRVIEDGVRAVQVAQRVGHGGADRAVGGQAR